MTISKTFKIFLFSAVILGLFAALPAMADIAPENYALLEPSVVGREASTGTNFVDYLRLMYLTVLSIAVILSVLMILAGGLSYITSNIPGNILEAKGRIGNAIGGLLLALLSWLILYTINPSLVSWKLDLSLGTGTPSTSSNNP